MVCGLEASPSVSSKRARQRSSQAAVLRLARAALLVGDAARRALVEGHDHVGAQPPLDVDHGLGGEAVAAPVDVAAKGDAVVVDVAGGGQREDLVTPRVGQDRSPPAHEVVQAAQLPHHLRARAQVQVVGVGQHHRCAGVRELLGRDTLDGARRAHRHEDRRFDHAAGKGQAPCAGPAVGGVEGEVCASGHPHHGITAMASPYE